MKTIHKIIYILAFSLSTLLTGEVPHPVQQHVNHADVVGSTRVKVLFWEVYDISLYSPRGDFQPEKPFALRLQYLRDIDGRLIAEKSVEEMRKQGIDEVKLADWFVQMRDIFPDVRTGSELIGVFTPGQPTLFYSGNEFIGQVLDPEFGMPFSSIWLGEDTSRPDIRKGLTGQRS